MMTVSLLAALTQRGVHVAPNKVGPDYIDPGYHSLVTGRVSRNLDPVLCPEEIVVQLLAHGAIVPDPADVAIIEGVMGLFDGRIGSHGAGSTAAVAKLTNSPVIAVVNAKHTSRTAAATVLGMRDFDPDLNLAAVIFNQVSSPRHAAEITDAMSRVSDVEVLGFVPFDAQAQAPSRHLGLIPVEERPEASEQLRSLGDLVGTHVDLDRLLEIAGTAPDLDVEPWDPERVVHAPGRDESTGDSEARSTVTVPSCDEPYGQAADLTPKPVVALAGGKAFTFRYAETVELMQAGGLDVVEFDPLRDTDLPEGTCGIYLGGGFPEIYASEIAANLSLRRQVRHAVLDGVPTVAECAGYLYLCRTLDDLDMAGAIPATAAMNPRLTMGYRQATAETDTLLAKAGDQITGHEFHRTRVTAEAPDSLPMAWSFDNGNSDGVSFNPSNSSRPTVHASYLHTHWAGYPQLAQHFIDAVHARHSKEYS